MCIVFPDIRGADIIAKTNIKITPDKPLDYHWVDHGLKVHIPAAAISGPPVTLYIQASFSGDYKLPGDGDFVSGVYWFCLNSPVKRFQKKVTVTIQHCASHDDPTISFITAKCTQKTLPYTFKVLPGGSFSECRYGSAEVNHFSALAIFGRKKSSYAFCTYYIGHAKKSNTYKAHITITPNLEKLLKVCICPFKIPMWSCFIIF